MTNEERFNNNIMMAYKIANRYRVTHDRYYEDIKQVALMALWVACCQFNEELGYAFSSYAYPTISNRINCYIRDLKRKEAKDISINTIVHEEITIEDILVDENNLIDEIISKVDIENVMENLYLTDKEKIVVQKRMEGKSQLIIGKEIGLSQAQISRILNNIKTKITNKIYIRERNERLCLR
jgi:RNA polymerase sigma factor (sigma-70 family)